MTKKEIEVIVIGSSEKERDGITRAALTGLKPVNIIIVDVAEALGRPKPIPYNESIIQMEHVYRRCNRYAECQRQNRRDDASGFREDSHAPGRGELLISDPDQSSIKVTS